MEKVNRKRLIINNNYYPFHLGKEFVAGIVLQGTEVKSVRNGQVQLKGAYAKVIDGEVFLFNCHIAEYAFGNRYNHEPLRAKKLLLNKDEISKLEQKIKLYLYFKYIL